MTTTKTQLPLSFDKKNLNWSENAEYNMMYLRSLQNHANDMLHHRGIVFLNEVYEMLGFPRTQDGQKLGWAMDEDFSCFIDFELQRMDDDSIRIWLNVDGDVLERLPR